MAYLAREQRSLQAIDKILETTSEIKAVVFDGLWNKKASNYQYRDRDTHQCPPGVNVYRGKGDEPFVKKTPLNPANRLILRVIGGRDYTPRVSAIIEGVDANGKPVNETLPGEAFTWVYGMGVTVSNNAYSQL